MTNRPHSGSVPLRPLLVTLAMALAGCARPAPDPWGAEAQARLTLRERAGQLVVASLDSARTELAGVELAGTSPEVAGRVDSLQRRAARPLLVVARLDEGVAGGTVFPPTDRLPGDTLAALAAEAIAAEARGVGINLARLRGPSLAAGPTEPSFAAALQGQGIPVLRTVLAAPADSAVADRAAVEAGPLAGLRAAAAAGLAGVELGWMPVPAVTGDTLPLAISPSGAAGLVRRDLGFDGVIVADLAPGSPWRRRYGARAPLAALVAGADLLLGVDDPGAAVDSLARAVAERRIPLDRLNASVRRVFGLKARMKLRPPDPAAATPRPGAPPPAHAALARRLHRASVRRGGDPAGWLRGCPAPVIAARRGTRADSLARGFLRLRTTGRLIAGDSVPVRPGGCTVVISVRGRGPVPVRSPLPPGDTTAPPPRLLVVSLGDPAASHAGADAWLSAPGTGPGAQSAVLDALAGRLTYASAPVRAAPVLVRSSAGEAGMRADSLARIDQVIRQAMADEVFTGAAIAIGRRGRLVKLAGYGRTGGRPVSPESTLFDLASLTKVVGTTSAAMTLVDDGELSLGAPLRRYLTGYRGGARGEVTIRHLLTHTAGLPPGDDLYGLSRSPAAAQRRVERTDLRTAPGERAVYSDFSMILLARAMEEATEQPLDQLLAGRVFGPLGMRSTQFRPPVMLQDRIVPTAVRSERPYVLDGVVHDGNAFRLGGVAGHAGLFSTAADVAVFAQTLLNGGAYGDQRVWSAATVRSFTTPQRLPGGRALGWDVPGPRSSSGDYFSPRSVGHTGYTGTSLWIDLDRGLFVVLLTNRTLDRGSQADIYRIRKRVHELAARAIADQRVVARAGTAAARAAERPRPRRPTPRRPRRPTRRG